MLNNPNAGGAAYTREDLERLMAEKDSQKMWKILSELEITPPEGEKVTWQWAIEEILREQERRNAELVTEDYELEPENEPGLFERIFRSEAFAEVLQSVILAVLASRKFIDQDELDAALSPIRKDLAELKRATFRSVPPARPDNRREPARSATRYDEPRSARREPVVYKPQVGDEVSWVFKGRKQTGTVVEIDGDTVWCDDGEREYGKKSGDLSLVKPARTQRQTRAPREEAELPAQQPGLLDRILEIADRAVSQRAEQPAPERSERSSGRDKPTGKKRPRVTLF